VPTPDRRRAGLKTRRKYRLNASLVKVLRPAEWKREMPDAAEPLLQPAVTLSRFPAQLIGSKSGDVRMRHRVPSDFVPEAGKCLQVIPPKKGFRSDLKPQPAEIAAAFPFEVKRSRAYEETTSDLPLRHQSCHRPRRLQPIINTQCKIPGVDSLRS
jgi:hypothetical protein